MPYDKLLDVIRDPKYPTLDIYKIVKLWEKWSGSQPRDRPRVFKNVYDWYDNQSVGDYTKYISDNTSEIEIEKQCDR